MRYKPVTLRCPAGHHDEALRHRAQHRDHPERQCTFRRGHDQKPAMRLRCPTHNGLVSRLNSSFGGEGFQTKRIMHEPLNLNPRVPDRLDRFGPTRTDGAEWAALNAFDRDCLFIGQRRRLALQPSWHRQPTTQTWGKISDDRRQRMCPRKWRAWI